MFLHLRRVLSEKSVIMIKFEERLYRSRYLHYTSKDFNIRLISVLLIAQTLLPRVFPPKFRNTRHGWKIAARLPKVHVPRPAFVIPSNQVKSTSCYFQYPDTYHDMMVRTALRFPFKLTSKQTISYPRQSIRKMSQLLKKPVKIALIQLASGSSF